jgi:hypothetical protein
VRIWAYHCETAEDPKVLSRRVQRVWFLPAARILIVDNLSTPGLDEVLQAAK